MAKIPKIFLPTKQQILEELANNKHIKGRRDLAKAFNIKGKARVPFKQLLREMKQEGLLSNNGFLPRDKSNQLPAVSVLEIPTDADPENLIAFPIKWSETLSKKPTILIKASRDSHSAPAAGDRVLARIYYDKNSKTYSAKVIKILQKQQQKQLSIVRLRSDGAFLIPISRKQKETRIAKDGLLENGAKDGDLVEAKVEPAGRLMIPTAKIIKNIGNPYSEGAISMIALHNLEIPYEFSKQVLNDAKNIQPVGMKGREDWRNIPFITIDPASAKDHDDAVYACPDDDKKNKGGHQVYVAIADVAAYVVSGSAIDKQAYLRGNSVYFPDRVVPMLPENISNNLCSLIEGQERPALALKMTFDKNGNKIAHSFHRVMMRSIAKLSYQQAQSAIDGNPDKTTKPLLESVLKPLWAAYNLMVKAREKRAPLELDLPERRIELDKNGMVTRITLPPRLEAHRLIEEMMIGANVCAAQTLEQHNSALLYRVHDRPGQEKLIALREFLSSLKMSFIKSDVVRTEHFNQALKKAKHENKGEQVSEMVLRSQSQAEYSPINLGHFGLNLDRYAHFTSPIRRYSDLIIHRALISALKLGDDGIQQKDIERMTQIGQHLSFTERRAMSAERETNDRLVAHFMSEKINTTFEGRISGVTQSGLFVRLNDTGADGFIPSSTIGDDYYRYIEEEQAMIGERTGESFRLGDDVRVKLVEVAPIQGNMRFELLSKGEIVKPPGRTSRKQTFKSYNKGRRRKH